MKKALCIVFATFAVFNVLFSQESLGSFEEEYYDSLSLLGFCERPALGYRTLSDSVWTLDEDAEHPWKNINLGSSFSLGNSLTLRLYGPEWFNCYNKSIPFGQNDGALWQGVGYNTDFSIGLRLEGYGFEVTFKPQLVWSQNKKYDYLPGINGFNESYYEKVDIIQRYGNSAYSDFSWGDSEIRYTWRTLTMGFGTQSPWLGPARLNPMLGSNNATPYPKFDIGIRKTPVNIPWIDWYAGDIEARMWLGKLEQSDYFSSTREDDRMLVTGSLSLSPSFIDGLSVGFNRVFMTYWDWSNLSYISRLFTTSHKNGTGSGNDEDQKLAIFADWSFPDVGFEVYGEYGFDDFSFYKIPDIFHTGIYTIGVKQVTPYSEKIYGVLNAEWNSFEISSDFYFQWKYLGYYGHGFVSQGYTNNGQVLGAGTGYFGNSQYLGYTLYYSKGSTTLRVHRYCNDNNHILNNAIFDKKHEKAGFTPEEVKAIRDKYGHYQTVLDFGFTTRYFLNESLCLSAGADLLGVLMWKYNANNRFLTASANFSVKCTF